MSTKQRKVLKIRQETHVKKLKTKTSLNNFTELNLTNN